LFIKISKVNKAIDSPLPFYATEHSSGLDISSASMNNITIEPMETKLIPTNLILEIPVGYEGQIRPRSGLAINHNIGIMNSPGTIDADYRGELKILLTNFGKEPYTIKFADRIAQLVITSVERVEIILSEDISETKRNTGGFGHTGLNNE
jgi:dUTP pyrophosphatase